MKIIIRENSVAENFSLIDPESGVDYIADFVGNTGALRDGQFAWDDELGAYVCSQETFDWWATVITDIQALDCRIHALTKEYGGRAVYDVVNTVDSADIVDHAEVINRVLDEHFGVAS